MKKLGILVASKRGPSVHVLCACFSSIIRLELMDAEQNKRSRPRVLHPYEYSPPIPATAASLRAECKASEMARQWAPPVWQEWQVRGGRGNYQHQ